MTGKLWLNAFNRGGDIIWKDGAILARPAIPGSGQFRDINDHGVAIANTYGTKGRDDLHAYVYHDGKVG